MGFLRGPCIPSGRRPSYLKRVTLFKICSSRNSWWRASGSETTHCVAEDDRNERPLESGPTSIDNITRLPTNGAYPLWRVRCKVFPTSVTFRHAHLGLEEGIVFSLIQTVTPWIPVGLRTYISRPWDRQADLWYWVSPHRREYLFIPRRHFLASADRRLPNEEIEI